MHFFLRIVPMAVIWMVLFILTGCKSNENQILPVALTDSIAIDIPISTFHIPITFPIVQLEQFLNQKIKGQFFETSLSPTKNEKDQVKVEMSRLSRIEISSGKGELICRVPLHVKATIIKSRLNFITKGIEPVETDLILELRTPADLDKNWQLVTKFDLTGIKWVNPPVVKLAGIPINLQVKLDEYLKLNKDKLTVLLDNEINKAVSLEKTVSKIWLDLQKPMVVVKKPPKAYIRFVCHDISGDFKISGSDLVCFTTIKAQVAMVTETNIKAEVVALPPFKPVKQNSDLTDAYVYAIAEFDELNDELGAKLNGKIFRANQYSITIKEVRTYASDSGLTVLMKAKGDIDATLTATVNPRFDSVSQSFEMENFQFHVVSDNVLLNMGNAMLHDEVRDTVQTYLAVSMDTLIRKVPALIEGAISKGKTGKSINVEISEFNILSCDINMGSKRLHFLVHAQLRSVIELKHINAGKKVNILMKEKKGQKEPKE
jgi:Domain of unknown function (DUF4403)